MKTEILSVDAKPIAACVRISAGNRVVSVSTVFTLPTVAVFDLAGKDITAQVLGDNDYANAANIARALGGAPAPSGDVLARALRTIAEQCESAQVDWIGSVQPGKLARAALANAGNGAPARVASPLSVRTKLVHALQGLLEVYQNSTDDTGSPVVLNALDAIGAAEAERVAGNGAPAPSVIAKPRDLAALLNRAAAVVEDAQSETRDERAELAADLTEQANALSGAFAAPSVPVNGGLLAALRECVQCLQGEDIAETGRGRDAIDAARAAIERAERASVTPEDTDARFRATYSDEDKQAYT